MLSRDAVRPIMRMQSAEIAPRQEALVARTGGRLGVFRQVAEIAARAGYCFSVADADGILLRLGGSASDQKDYSESGIALGSCWDERIAGTNGVSMAMVQGKPCTVRGKEHYFSKLSSFACTSVPLLDAENRMTGMANLAAVDRGNVADYLFAQQLLGAAADRIQRVLFERRYRDLLLVSLSLPGSGDLLGRDELVAVDEAGLIRGSTGRAHRILGMAEPLALHGRAFDAVFGADAESLGHFPERVLRIRAENGATVRLSGTRSGAATRSGRGWQAPAPVPERRPPRTSPAPTIQDLAVGSAVMATRCAMAETQFLRGQPLVIEGESGTGKSALIAALHRAARLADSDVMTIDCAMLGDGPEDRQHIRTVLGQARVLGLFEGPGHGGTTLVFDNIDELPPHAQAGLRNLLAEIECDHGQPDADALSGRMRVAATVRKPLLHAVQAGWFRDDLYYLLTSSLIVLPPVRQREKPDVLAGVLASDLAGGAVEISPEAMAVIVDHDWPGNVRQLRSVLRQALMLGGGSRLSLDDLRATSALAASSGPGPAVDRPAFTAPPLHGSERADLINALMAARWNVSKAARSLGIGRATIHRKMKQHDIFRPTQG